VVISLSQETLDVEVESKGLDVRSLYKEYLETLTRRQVNPETRTQYLRVIDSFLKTTDWDLSREAFLNYLKFLQTSKTANHIRWNYEIIHGFYKVLGVKIPVDLKELPQATEPQRPYLETDEAEKLMEMAKSNITDYAILRLVSVTGIRKRELRELNLSDYDRPRLIIRTRKHGEQRIRTLDEDTLDAIDAYVNGPRTIWDGNPRKPKTDEPLFISPTGIRLVDSTLTKKFAMYARALGKPMRTGFHSLRRSVVTWEAESGMNDMEIQKLHGWKSNQMPSIYARLKPAKLELASYAGNPLIKKKKEI